MAVGVVPVAQVRNAGDHRREEREAAPLRGRPAREIVDREVRRDARGEPPRRLLARPGGHARLHARGERAGARQQRLVEVVVRIVSRQVEDEVACGKRLQRRRVAAVRPVRGHPLRLARGEPARGGERGPEARPVVEPERAARDRLRVARAELVRIDDEPAAAVERAERAQHLRPQERGLAAAERVEDVDARVRLAKQRRDAAVADRNAIDEQQVARVGLERQPAFGRDADDGQRGAFGEVAPPDLVEVRIGHRIDLAAARGQRGARRRGHSPGPRARQPLDGRQRLPDPRDRLRSRAAQGRAIRGRDCGQRVVRDRPARVAQLPRDRHVGRVPRLRRLPQPRGRRGRRFRQPLQVRPCAGPARERDPFPRREVAAVERLGFRAGRQGAHDGIEARRVVEVAPVDLGIAGRLPGKPARDRERVDVPRRGARDPGVVGAVALCARQRAHARADAAQHAHGAAAHGRAAGERTQEQQVLVQRAHLRPRRQAQRAERGQQPQLLALGVRAERAADGAQAREQRGRRRHRGCGRQPGPKGGRACRRRCRGSGSSCRGLRIRR